MPHALAQLFGGAFDQWLAAAAPPPPLWLFVHVPKTAGSSLAAEIAAELKPYRSIHIDHLDRNASGPERFDRAVEAAIAAYAERPFRFASGHVQQRQVARIVAAVPGARLFTMLREPAARLLSDYLYQRSDMHPLAAEVKQRVPDFDAFLQLPGQRNRTAKHLVPKRLIDAEDAAGAIAYIERSFAFVGLQERYPLGFRALTTMLGRQIAPGEKRRVNSAAAAERAEIGARLADPSLAARIAERNALDFAIHAHFTARWDRIAEPLGRWLDARSAAAAA